MNNKGLIYLSGGMESATDGGSSWRKFCSEELQLLGYQSIDISAIDSLYIKECGAVYLKNELTERFLECKANIQYQFIYTDLELIKTNADAVIAYYDQSFKDGAGSFCECQRAYDYQKPLFVVSDFTHVPLWLRGLSTKVFSDFLSLYDYLEKLPSGILKKDVYGNHHSNHFYLCSLCGDVFEKSKHHFVSKVSPLYCKGCVELVSKTREKQVDRYWFSVKQLEEKNAIYKTK